MHHDTQTDEKTKPLEEVEANPNSTAQSEFIGRQLKEARNSDEPIKDEEASEEENLESMSDNDFLEHMWKKFCGQPRPAKFSFQQESKSNDDGRDLDG